ncbi:hypothetical protein NHX12_017890 [Muraenolepis orangiensis]|uniref:Beta-galactosidase 1-like first all-beta domain-containing protein n=1 Tax=Muraenolepis orangiensis TaxID=630683 RepID=A0A9Q0EVK0_9TELE|nr:hypothetical protein NHX12_017890 [Muraenolepis orangiensis]
MSKYGSSIACDYDYMLHLSKLFQGHLGDEAGLSYLQCVSPLVQVPMGILERSKVLTINITGSSGSRVDLLVENMGRLNYGGGINDFKGLVSNLTLGEDVLSGWTMYSLNIDEAVSQGLIQKTQAPGSSHPASSPAGLSLPTFYSGSFRIPDGIPDLPQDTYDLRRYWPVRGPQVTLFVPANVLSTAAPNNVTLLELEGSPCTTGPCVVEFTETPILNTTVSTGPCPRLFLRGG